MAKAKKIGQCALCGEMRQVTREHVPPKNLFLAPRPRNTITVPVCEPCNHGFHLDDEYFRIYVAIGAEPGTRHGRLWTEKVVGSSFARSGGLKGRLNDDYAKLLEHHKGQPLRTFDNDVVGDEWLPFVQSFQASRIIAVVEKIIRCLHFFRVGAPLPLAANFDVSVAPINKAELVSLHERRAGGVGHYDEFVFWCEQKDSFGSRWILSFYGHHTFDVRVYAR